MTHVWNVKMDTTTLAAEATHYLKAIDLFRSMAVRVEWRAEADELAARRTAEVQSEPECGCIRPGTRINGRHVCFGVD
jgi:hypothetical protein